MGRTRVTFDEGETVLELVDVEHAPTAGLMGDVLIGWCSTSGRPHRISIDLPDAIEEVRDG